MLGSVILRCAGIALLALLVACGGGGNDGLPPDPGPPVDFSGRWSVVDNFRIYRSTSAVCLEGEGVLKMTLTITQDEFGQVLVTGAPYGSFEGQVEANRLTWEGMFLETGPNRWTRVRDMILIMQPNGALQPGEGLQDIALGTGFFDYYENIGRVGGLLCSGESHFSAVRIN